MLRRQTCPSWTVLWNRECLEDENSDVVLGQFGRKTDVLSVVFDVIAVSRTLTTFRTSFFEVSDVLVSFLASFLASFSDVIGVSDVLASFLASVSDSDVDLRLFGRRFGHYRRFSTFRASWTVLWNRLGSGGREFGQLEATEPY